VEIEGMGHDYPAEVWDLWVETWADFVRSAGQASGNQETARL
jgi:hypothetical protein